MNISNQGIKILKQLEGCVKNGDKHIIYDDQTGCPVDVNKPLPRGATIGYGHLIKAGENFADGITEARATEILRADIATAECAVQNNITVPISQNQYDALVMLAYNIGAKNFANSSVVKYINNPNFQGTRYPTLADAWRAWNKSGGRVMPGLVRRRNKEWQIFQMPYLTYLLRMI